MSGLVSAKFRVTGDFGAAFTDMDERGFINGLPVIPPAGHLAGKARACVR